MRRAGTWVSLICAFLLFGASWSMYQYREARDRIEAGLHSGNYPEVLQDVVSLRNSAVLFPLRWGTPFFLKNVAAEISFIEAESWNAFGEKRKAREAYEKAAELFRDNRKSHRASAYHNAAVIALELQKYLEVRELLHKALNPLTGDPHHFGAKANLERLEGMANAQGLLPPLRGKEEEGRKLFGERDPLDPWSKETPGDNTKQDKKRR